MTNCLHTIKFLDWFYHISMVPHINHLQSFPFNSCYDHHRLVKMKWQLDQFICSSPVFFFLLWKSTRKNNVLLQTWEKSYRNTWNAKNYLWKRNCSSHACLEMVYKIWKDVRAVKFIQWELLTRNYWLVIKLVDQLQINWQMICQIAHEDLGMMNICGKCGNNLMDELLLPWHLNTS